MALSVLPLRDDDDQQGDERGPAAPLTPADEAEIERLESKIRTIRARSAQARRSRLMTDDLIEIQEMQSIAAIQSLRSLGDLMPVIYDDLRQNNQQAYAGLPLGLGKPVASLVTAVDSIFRVAPALHRANMAAMAMFPETLETVAQERTDRVGRYLATGAASAAQDAALVAAKAEAEVERVRGGVVFDQTQAVLKAEHDRVVEMKQLDQAHELAVAQQKTDDRIVMMGILQVAAGGSGIDAMGEDIRTVGQMVAEIGLSKTQEEGARPVINSELQRQAERRARTHEDLVRMALSGGFSRPPRRTEGHDPDHQSGERDRGRNQGNDHERHDEREGGRDGDHRR